MKCIVFAFTHRLDGDHLDRCVLSDAGEARGGAAPSHWRARQLRQIAAEDGDSLRLQGLA